LALQEGPQWTVGAASEFVPVDGLGSLDVASRHGQACFRQVSRTPEWARQRRRLRVGGAGRGGVPFEFEGVGHVREGDLPEILGSRIGVLLDDSKELTEEDGKELEEVLAKFTSIILDAPDTVLDKLTDSKRILVAHAFMGLLPENLRRAGAEAMEAEKARRMKTTPSTGAK